MPTRIIYRLSPARADSPTCDLAAKEWRRLLAVAGLAEDTEGFIDKGAVRQFRAAVEDIAEPELRMVLTAGKLGVACRRVIDTEAAPSVESRAPTGPGSVNVRVVEREDLVFVRGPRTNSRQVAGSEVEIRGRLWRRLEKVAGAFDQEDPAGWAGRVRDGLGKREPFSTRAVVSPGRGLTPEDARVVNRLLTLVEGGKFLPARDLG
jgi:hypothetical protein